MSQNIFSRILKIVTCGQCEIRRHEIFQTVLTLGTVSQLNAVAGANTDHVKVVISQDKIV